MSPVAPGPAVQPVDAPSQPSLVPDGRSTRWADHRAARRVELVHAARRAVHKVGPEISMDEIATHAGTSKSIVYRYFVDKPGLQLAVGEAVVAQMRDALAAAAHTATTPRDSLRSMVAVYLEMIEHSPNVYYFVTRTAPGLPFLDSMIEIVARPFAQELDVAPADAAAWGSGAVGFVRGSGEWWLENRGAPGAPTRQELTARVTAWLWGGPVGVLARESGDSRDDADHRPAATPIPVPTPVTEPGPAATPTSVPTPPPARP